MTAEIYSNLQFHIIYEEKYTLKRKSNMKQSIWSEFNQFQRKLSCFTTKIRTNRM